MDTHRLRGQKGSNGRREEKEEKIHKGGREEEMIEKKETANEVN